MREWQSLAHVKWECKYRVVIVPKYRRKTMLGHVRKRIGKLFQQLCRQKEIGLIEGHVMPDHVHMLLSIPVFALRCLAAAVSGSRRNPGNGAQRAGAREDSF